MVEKRNYDRLGGHFDISTEDGSDIHVGYKMEWENMFHLPPLQRRRIGDHHNPDA